MTTLAPPAARTIPSTTTAAPAAWIVSRGQDLLWFQGSVLAGLALLAVFVAAPRLDDASAGPWHPVLVAVLLWGIAFDGTHVWGTYARSYLAEDEASRAMLPGSWAWAVLAVGPAVALFAAPLFGFFLVGANLWGYWHLVRQHYGFLMLYRRRAGQHDRGGARLDALLLWVGCAYPYLRFSLSDAYVASGLPLLLPPPALAALRRPLDLAFALAVAGLATLVLSGRIEPFRPAPRHLLLAVVTGFHILVFALLDNLLAILATLTIFHNLQYHRIVWQYERGRGRVPSGSLTRYLALGLAFGAVWYGARVLGVAVAPSETTRNVLLGLGWGVAFHHYIVDGRIWRIRRSPDVARTLDDGARAS
jgi:hypothetical protein